MYVLSSKAHRKTEFLFITLHVNEQKELTDTQSRNTVREMCQSEGNVKLRVKSAASLEFRTKTKFNGEQVLFESRTVLLSGASQG